MACPYYKYDHGYACIKLGDNVNETIYCRYCRDYSYSDCPVYKAP